MNMSKVGNQTNSQDPQAINSRVFVGNLNTFQVTKNEIEKMFQRYGRIAGISMHKGYAFVQFTNPFDARSACIGEDGRNLSGQILDVNMVAEPKPHQVGRKRQNISKTGNDWEYYYDSYCSPAAAAAAAAAASMSPTGPTIAPRLVPPMKRPRLVMGNGPGPRSSPTPQNKTIQLNSKQTIALDQLKTYSSPDILICGNCREMFSDIGEMIDHKKSYCKLRFTCKCESNPVGQKPAVTANEDVKSLVCKLCKETFKNPMDLMNHAQNVHLISIFEAVSTAKSSDEINGTTSGESTSNMANCSKNSNQPSNDDPSTGILNSAHPDVETSADGQQSRQQQNGPLFPAYSNQQQESMPGTSEMSLLSNIKFEAGGSGLNGRIQAGVN